jgi:hypothetical protein
MVDERADQWERIHAHAHAQSSGRSGGEWNTPGFRYLTHGVFHVLVICDTIFKYHFCSCGTLHLRAPFSENRKWIYFIKDYRICN